MKTFKIAYTSDVHGQLGAVHYPTNTKAMFGLSRLATYLKEQAESVLYIDNGDLLQGSPLMDYSRQQEGSENPAAKAMNLLQASYITLGNHDFNYGLNYLQDYLHQVNATLLCANVLLQGQPIGESFVCDKRFGIRLGLIGVTTAYVPHWEPEEHLQGLRFVSAAATVQQLIATHRKDVDLMVVVYHGGFETNPLTNKPMGRQTIENEAAAIAAISGVDVLLTGHQHMSMQHQSLVPKLLQPAMNVREFGEVQVTTNNHSVVHVEVALIQNNFPEDLNFVAAFDDLEAATSAWLDTPIGTFEDDLRVRSVLDVRQQPHRLVDWIHQLQRHACDADISIVSLPNEMAGFQGDVTIRDVAATFVFANTLAVLSMTGSAILAALEQTATYFEVEQGRLVTSPAFLSPKVEHYNYDMYQGIEYVIDASQPVGHRVRSCLFQGTPIDPTHRYKVVCNNYRAGGGGDYSMFEAADVLMELDRSTFDLAMDYIQKNHPVRVAMASVFTVLP